MNNSPEGAQGSANSKTPLTQTGVPFILEAIPAEAYQEFSHIFIIRDGGALGHSPKMSEATIGYTRYRKQDAEYIASAVNEYPDLSRQLAQSEERVKALTEGLDKLTAWGMYCPDWADRNSKDEYAKDFMAALALLQNKLR